MCRRSLGWLILSGLVLMLTGCASSPGHLAVDLKALKECQRLGNQASLPDITEDSDYRNLSAAALGQLNKANRGIAARTRCENSVIEKYGAAK